MPNKSSAERAGEQLNLKLPSRRYEVLKAAAYVRGAPNLRELVMPIIDQFIDELVLDEDVQLAMRARAQAQARGDGVLTDLHTRKAAGD